MLDAPFIASLSVVARCAVGLTLFIAAVPKLREPQAFTLGVLDYDVLPRRAAKVYAAIVPLLELTTGAGLVVGSFPQIFALIALLLLSTFVIGVGMNVARNRSIDCHCFGSGSGDQIGWPTVTRLVVLMSLSAVTLATPSTRTLSVPEALTAVGVVVGLYLLGAVPLSLRSWRVRGAPRPTRHGERIEFRALPLIRIAEAVQNRSGEQSLCGACGK